MRVYSLVSSPFPYICVCMCVCLTKKNKKILSVVKSSQMSNVWYWEGINYLLRDTNCRKQFWFWGESVFPYLIPFCLCICVYVRVHPKKEKKLLSVVKSSHIGNVWYWEGVYHLQGDTMCRMQFYSCLVSVFSCLIPLPLYNLSVCVFHKKRKEKKDTQCCQVVPHR